MGKLLTAVWAEKEKYQVSLSFARQHTKIHLKYRARQPMDSRVNVIPILLGDSGIGKTAITKRIAQDLGVRYCRWDANAQLFDDNLGVPDPEGKVVELSDGETKKKTVNMEADLLPIFEDEPLILEVGELPTATTNVLNQIREIIDGIFINKEVSPTCMLVATGNPLTADYTTVNADLCQSIEERLHPYIVVPEKTELLSLWSTIMPTVVYQFLLAHQDFVDDLSPRCWMALANYIQAELEEKIVPADIIKGIKTKVVGRREILPPLLSYMQSGYRPDKVPILGRELLAADDEMAAIHLKRIQGWFGRNERGFIGSTKLDVARVMMQGDEKFMQLFPKAPERFTEFVECLIANKAQDIASSLVDALYRSDKKFVGKPIMSVYKHSKSIVEMGRKFREFMQAHQEALA